VFDQNVGERSGDRLSTEADLRAAVTSDQLRLHYQPIVAMSDGSILGAEALLRWEHPTRGRLAPDASLDVAEETGIISSIGSWVVGDACRQLAAWSHDPAFADFTVHVNVSVRQLRDGGVAETIRSALTATGIDPDRL